MRRGEGDDGGTDRIACAIGEEHRRERRVAGAGQTGRQPDPPLPGGIRPELPDWARAIMEREEVYQVLPADLDAIENAIEAHTRAERVSL